jgi:hypothetical protein
MGNAGIVGVLSAPFVVSIILILVAGRRDVAGAERRTEARYLGALGYVVLFVALIASYTVVHALMQLVVDRPFDSDNAHYRTATQAGLIAVVAIGIFLFLFRYRQRLVAEGVYEATAPSSVARAYTYAVCFTAMIIVLVSAPAAVYGVFRVIGPGVYGSGTSKIVRRTGFSELVSFGYLAVGSLLIFRAAWARRTPASVTPVNVVPPS